MNQPESPTFEPLVEAHEVNAGDAATAREFGALLSENATDREAWIEQCLLEGLLENDEKIAAALASDVLPDNVVALPGHRPRVGEASRGQTVNASRRGGRGIIWLAAAAMVGAAAIVAAIAGQWLSNFGPEEPGALADKGGGAPAVALTEDSAEPGGTDGALAATPTLERETGADARQSEYDKMLLAEVHPGSLSRPPTPFVSASAPGGTGELMQRVSFNRDIRPILSDNCVECHGPDAAAREADLRLDREQDAVVEEKLFEAGEAEAPVVRGRPDLSELILRIEAADGDDLMPPPKSHKVLTVQQIALLKRWVEDGAPWEEHWAFVAPQLPSKQKEETAADVNPVGTSNPAITSEIDRLVLERLHREGLKPSPQADRQTLIRRLTLDLTGLPPKPDEIASFVADEDSLDGAYEKVVDRLLASKAYGEHRARYWLDAARYADTHGLHLDNYREMWPYRDWVIDAFNRNQPFDRFTIEQLAGDLLEKPSQAQLVATGFNRCNVTTSEGGAIAEEFAVRYAIDRVATTATVWLGLTVGCAQCHDHKYDPISMREFYRMYAYFNNTTQKAMDGNVPDTPPVIRVYRTPEQEAEEKAIKDRLKTAGVKASQARKAAEKAFAAWLDQVDPATLTAWSQSAPPGLGAYFSTDGEQARSLSGFSVANGKPFTLVARIEAPEEPGYYPLVSQIDAEGRGFRLSLDLDNQATEMALFGEGGEKGAGGALKIKQIRRIKPGAKSLLVITCDASGDAEGITVYVDGREMDRRRFPYLYHADLRDRFTVTAATPMVIEAEGNQLRELWAFERILSDEEIKLIQEAGATAAAAKKAGDSRSDADKEKLRRHFLVTHDEGYRKALVAKAKAEVSVATFERRVPVTHVMSERDAAPKAHMLERGEYDKKLEEVTPGVPGALPPLPENAPENRLGLARWLVASDHPLTARVTVNRLWQQLFGTGLVKTAEDFGSQGEPPSHPQLLDWLAVDFVEGGWDVKRTLKQMVMSATYRQSSRVSAELLAVDPDNRLLARGPRFRLDAEVIRDQALAASGLLDESIGGPAVRPYQPGGLWKAVGYSNSNTVQFARDHGGRLYRRSIYTFWKRTAPPPNMTAFDAPDRESCTVRRERTNTPLQALVLMNDVQFVEASRHLAERGMDAGVAAVEVMAARVLGRPLDSAEKAIIDQSRSAFLATYRADPEAARALLTHGDRSNNPDYDAAELAALTMVASQLLNLDEAITKN